jgi:hypothetical protein
MRVWLLAVVALTLAAWLDVGTSVQEGRITVRASRAPIADVLDRLAATTGMRVVYDGARPRALVTVNGTWDTLVEAVMAVMQGSGMNYAFITDPSGTRIATLVVTERNAAAGEAAARSSGPVPAMPAPEPEDPELSTDSPEPEPSFVPLRPQGGPAGTFRAPDVAPPVAVPLEAPTLPANPSGPPLPPEY